MKKPLLLLSFMVSFFLVSLVQGNDMEVVRSIIGINDFHMEQKIEELVKTKAGRVVELYLNNKDFSREGISFLPKEIGNLTELRILTLNDNDLTTIPKELYNLKNLTILELKNNNLEVLDADIKKLSKLQKLDLRNNELTILPREIGKLSSLLKLQLWGNELKQLPSTISNLSSLKELYLRGNKLSSLPTSITKLGLNYLDILDNHLCSLPQSLNRWLEKYDKNFKSTQLCGKIDYQFRFRNYKP